MSWYSFIYYLEVADPAYRKDIQEMFAKSVKGTVKLISQQITHVESIGHDGDPCEVTVGSHFLHTHLNKNHFTDQHFKSRIFSSPVVLLRISIFSTKSRDLPIQEAKPKSTGPRNVGAASSEEHY